MQVILSICPPHAALQVARSLAGSHALVIDANAVSPATARAIGSVLEGNWVDGGIVGPPPYRAGTTRLYVSGTRTDIAAELFAGTALEVVVVGGSPVAASTVKMAYAAWTKGTSALLLACRALARSEGVEQTLLGEWALSQPALRAQSERSAAAAAAKGWRWVAEMEEIAASMAAAGLPAGFHQAAAEIFDRAARADAAAAGRTAAASGPGGAADAGDSTLDTIMSALI